MTLSRRTYPSLISTVMPNNVQQMWLYHLAIKQIEIMKWEMLHILCKGKLDIQKLQASNNLPIILCK